MKDFYIFDSSKEFVLEIYDNVCLVYLQIFEEMKFLVLVVKVSLGNMGGNFSYEYYFFMLFGEDYVISCDSCNYVVNEEVVELVFFDQVVSDMIFCVW